MKPTGLRIVEVGPRDGLQNLSGFVATDRKIDLIRRLAACGIQEIQAEGIGQHLLKPRAFPRTTRAKEKEGSVGALKKTRNDGRSCHMHYVLHAVILQCISTSWYAAASSSFSSPRAAGSSRILEKRNPGVASLRGGGDIQRNGMAVSLGIEWQNQRNRRQVQRGRVMNNPILSLAGVEETG